MPKQVVVSEQDLQALVQLEKSFIEEGCGTSDAPEWFSESVQFIDENRLKELGDYFDNMERFIMTNGGYAPDLSISERVAGYAVLRKLQKQLEK